MLNKLSVKLLTALSAFTISTVSIHVSAQAIVVGSTPAEFSVSNGSVNYSIPIQVAPGRSGMQPSLSLSYSNDGGNSVLGVGWGLGGLSAIHRCSQTFAQDGQRRGVNFNADDRYCLDGQRLIPRSGSDGAVGIEYRTEIDGYSQIISVGGSVNNPDYWLVKTKAGQVITYGGVNGDATHSFPQGNLSWSIRTINDTTGNNPITFIYDIIDNYQYLYQVRYSGNIVKINYQGRPDVIKYMSLGSEVKIDRRISNIEIIRNSNIVKTYQLNYQENTDYSLSTIASVNECNEQSCYKPNHFNYDSSPFSYSAVPTSRPSGGHGGAYEKQSGDYNGDGITDIALIHWSDGYGWIAKIALGNGDGTFAPSLTSKPSSGHGGAYEKQSGDYNGDGVTDIALIHWSDDYGWIAKIALGRGDGTFAPSVTSTPSGGHGGAYEKQSGDYNGDGITDIALIHWSDGYGWIAKIALGNGDGTFAPSLTSTPSGGHGGAYEKQSGDYNGDGITDIALIHWSDGYGWIAKIALGNGDGTFAPSVTSNPSGGHGGAYEKQSGDYNGDGITDIALIHWSDGYGWIAKIALGRGDGTFSPSLTSNPSGGHGGAYEKQSGDYNGDGITDIALIHWSDGYGWIAKIALGNGDGTFLPSLNSKPSGGHGGAYSKEAGDYNGDGITDIALIHWSDGYGWIAKVAISNSRFIKLDTVQDSNNHLTQIDYKLLTDSAFYIKSTGAQFPVQDLQVPMYVVSKVESSNGIGGTTGVEYQYEGLKTHVQGRGFYGFSKVTEFYPDTKKKLITIYDQSSFPHAGNVLTVEEQYNGDTVNYSTNTYDDILHSQGYYQFYLQQSQQTSYALGDDTNFVTRITSNFSNIDDYGNFRRVEVATTDSSQTFTKITESTYTNDSFNWFIGRLTTSKTTHKTPYGDDDTRRSEFTYDANTGLLKTESIIGAETGKLLNTTHYTYDAYGQKQKVTLAASGVVDRISTTTYNSIGQPTKSCNALNQCETYTYTDQGWLETTTGPNNITTTWIYDSFGRKEREDRADGTWSRTQREFANSGLCGELATPFGANSVYTCAISETSGSPPVIVQYDALGRQLRTIKKGFDGRLIYSDTEYNHLAQVTRTSREYYVGDAIYWATSEYDALGRVIRMTEPGPHGSRNEINYDYGGLTTTVYSGPEQRAKTTINNAIGQKIRIEEEENTYVEYTYNSDGNLLTTQVAGDPDTTITLHYDEFGRKVAMDDPDMGYWSYAYDAFGQLISQTDALDQTITMAYDTLGRMVSRNEPEGTSTWQYYGNNAPQGSIGKLYQESGNGQTKTYT